MGSPLAESHARARTHGPRLCALCLVLWACAGCSTLTSYPQRTSAGLRSFAAFDFDAAYNRLGTPAGSGNDRLCYLLERATVLHTKGDFARSTREFFEAEKVMRHHDEKAIISLSDTAAGAAAFLVNDKAMPYGGEGFEKILLHTYLALNYLLQHDLEGARVEVRRAYERQKEERRRKESRLDKARERAHADGIAYDRMMKQVRQRRRGDQALLRNVGNVYQNAFTSYISSLIYELNGEPNHAYVDCKQIYGFNPRSRLAQEGLLRYSEELGFHDDHEKWKRTFPGVRREGRGPGTGWLVVLYQCGMAPVKKEEKLTLLVPDRAPRAKGEKARPLMVAFAFPRYESRSNPVASARVHVDGRLLGETETLADVDRMARRFLWDRMPVIVARQAVRTAAKLAGQHYARKEGGGLGWLAAALFTAVSEQADLRCWLTLPRSLQALRASVPAGDHEVRMALVSAGGSALSEIRKRVTVRENGMTLINLRTVGAAGRASVVVY